MKTIVGVAAWAAGTVVFVGVALIMIRQIPVLRDWTGQIPPQRDFVSWARARMSGIGGASDEDSEEAA